MPETKRMVFLTKPPKMIPPYLVKDSMLIEQDKDKEKMRFYIKKEAIVHMNWTNK